MRTLIRLTAFTVCLLASDAFAALTVAELQCEQLREAVGIDTPAPRLTWRLASDERGDRQTAYRLLVASTAEKLAAGEGDLWDSGRVDSGDSLLIPYAGKPLATHQACHWKVRAWDAAGEPSPWSEPGEFSMGVMKGEDWQAEWIGLDVPKRVEYLEGPSWIWLPGGEPTKAAEPGERYFRREIDVPSDRGAITQVTYRICADDRVTIYYDGREIGRRGGPNATKEMDLTHRFTPGRHVLGAAPNNQGDEPSPAGLIAKLIVEFADGEPYIVMTDSSWRCHPDLVEGWADLDFDDSAWSDANELGEAGIEPWGPVRHAEGRRLAARHLRKEFTIDKPIARAVVSLSGLGSSELYLNGEKVGDHVLSPAMSEYPERSYYVTHDVTDMLAEGKNAAGVLLGNGRFYAMRSEVYAGMPTYGSPKLLLQLRVEHPDGSESTFVSDPTWKLTEEGPIRANNEYDGEEYDARRELTGWAEVGYDDTAWQNAEPTDAPSKTLSAQMIEPIRVTQTLAAKSITEPRPGVYVVDLGQNIVGWCRLHVEGPAGTRVRLRHAETLKSDGAPKFDNLRGAKATDYYTLRGDGREVYEPRFTYHGFRFVELTGLPTPPTLQTVEGRVVHDDLTPVGRFECSSDLLNQVHENIRWGLRGNYRSVPTDCPQRDERQAWLGDRIEIARGETYLFDAAAFYSKWLRDIRDCQRDDGAVPNIAPGHWPNYSTNVVWPSASVFLPGMLFSQYGDARTLEQHYASMARWIDFIHGYVRDDGLIDRDNYGDWCVPPEDPLLIHSVDPARKTDTTLLASSFLCYDLKTMGMYAWGLRKQDDQRRYFRMSEEMSDAINGKYYNEKLGQYDNGTQTSSVLPLYFGIAPQADRDKVFRRLVTNIEEKTHGHIGTGLVGGQFLFRTLNDHGRADLALEIATQSEYPGWGYMISQGATTIWELWNGDTADPAMNSGNHAMLIGDLLTWMYEDLAGIAPDVFRPGFQSVKMTPQIVEGLDFVKAAHLSPLGWIESEWRRDGDALEWRVVVPTNATAELRIPVSDLSTVTESGAELTKAPGVAYIGSEAGRVIVEVGGGEYRFRVE
ncbi:Bacterial alpha-L-rhamnosidase [Pseudobythopirellula maris]|uniref:alpha-L-rhamnosidase n=1 Tax=Pseudobythopirellula maris TaxID=2527991 RepID=A0A5C5ZU26_9BACT|nr:alpha-L-rhamnosidase [Pseudobythopirellula maris]TWT91074.1 Bacterial alpha-L-rhamnosidase [Pseudobythopirellula maris]